MPKSRRVAVMLELDSAYKRHVGIFAGVQEYAQEHGWETIIDEYAVDSIAHPTKPVHYQGILARATKKLALRAARLNIPLVNVWYSSPIWKDLPGVFADFYVCGRLRAEHLLSRGLRRFAALISDNDRSQERELQGFLETLQAAGEQHCVLARIPRDASATASAWKTTERTIANWMESWVLPIGVFVGHDIEARMVVQMCTNRGWRVPEDVAIIGGLNEETYCERIRPTMSSIEIGFERIGYEAARLLDQLMDGKASPQQPLLIPPRGLIVRESTDFFSIDDESVMAALKFIATNSHRRIGQNDVARAVAVETRTLQRRFQQFLQRPIVAEIRRVRIERAKRELADGQRSIAEIAHDVGFGVALRMYEIFKRELGVSPSEYRKQRQKLDSRL